MKQIFYLILFSLALTQVRAANFYWKGGNGNFNDPNMWAIDSLTGATASQTPISTDNVFFTAAAFTMPGAVIELTSNASCKSMLWENGIPLANAPEFRGLGINNNLDIYGDFRLSTNMTWNVRGNLRFVSTEAAPTVHRIRSSNNRLLLNSLVFQTANLVEYQLQDDLYVDDPAQANTNLNQGVITLNSGYLNSTGKTIRCDFFNSTSNNPLRRLNIENSRFEVFGRNNINYAWNIDFDGLAASPNFVSFDCTGSHIVQAGSGYDWIRLGRGIAYDTITLDYYFANPTSDYSPYTYINTNGAMDRDTIEHLIVKRRAAFIYGNSKMIIKHIELHPEAILSANSSDKTIEVETITTVSTCGQMPHLGAHVVSDWNDRLFVKKISPGNLAMNNLILSRVHCDISNGSTYTASNSIERGDNLNISVTGATGREMFFRATATSQDWNDLSNWQDWNGSIFSPSSCLPTPFDNVYFDGSSFNAANRVDIPKRAYCKAMRWLPSIPANAQLRLGNLLQMFGSLEYDDKMRFTSYNGFGGITMGGQGDSLISKGVVNNNFFVYLDAYSEVELVDNYEGRIRGNRFSKMIMQADTLRPRGNFYISDAEFNGTQIYITEGSWAFRQSNHAATAIDYTGNATVHWVQNAANNQYAFYGTFLPNLIVYGRMNSTYHNIQIRGNLTIKEGAEMILGNTQFGGTNYAALRLIGGLNGAQGDLIMEAGSNLVLTSFGGANSRVEIAGDMSLLGNCQKMVNIGTHDGNPLPGNFAVSGTTNIQYANIRGLPNISAAPNNTIIANNSNDLGNNSGWSFVSGTGTTYYWRAHIADPANFVGDWQDPGHWTVNPLSPVGDSACVPGTMDDVFFDALSFSGTTSRQCNITTIARCRDLNITAAARISMATAELHCRNMRFTNSDARWDGVIATWVGGPGRSQTFISENLELAPNMTELFYRGDINMVGAGTIESQGSRLQVNRLSFNNPTGVWHLQDALYLDNSWGGTSEANRRCGELEIRAGELHSNSHDITISSYFSSQVNAPRALHLGSSTLHHLANSYYRTNIRSWLWRVTNPASFTLTFNPDAEIIFEPSSNFVTLIQNTRLDFFMGDNIDYPNVNITDDDQPVNIYGSSNYNYLQLEANAYVDGNNSFDSLRMEGGYFYRFRNSSLQELNAPHGRIISNGTGSSFVNIESSVAGSPFTLRKAYGPAFCIDFVKVRDCIGEREANIAAVPTAPIDYQLMHPFLEFQTGVNSDNIGGTATGIWAFSLPPLVTPQRVGPNPIQLCMVGATNVFPLQFTGTSPYRLDYTWTDAASNTGNNTLIFSDDDNDPSTPFSYNVPLPSNNGPVVFDINIRTSRCGDLTPNGLSSVSVTLPSPELLVAQPRSASCSFNNEPFFLTLVDDVDSRPILSIQDSANATDNQALGQVDVEVFFDPTVQFWNDGFIDYPYLQRHWQVRPTTNGPALVRLYFTQAELAALGAAGLFNPSITASPLDIQLRKFSGNGVGIGTMQIIPHTVIPLTGGAALPFSSTANVLAIEFEVASFSHFIITPTDAALLPLGLLDFQAQYQEADKHVALSWQVEQEGATSSYQIERSSNMQDGRFLGEVAAQGLQNYSFIDPAPLAGTSYYRLRSLDASSGEYSYSPWRSVEIESANSLDIFPNPSSGIVNLRLEAADSESLSLRLFDALGRLVHEQHLQGQAGIQTEQLQLGHLPSGIYLLQLEGQGSISFRRRLILE